MPLTIGSYTSRGGEGFQRGRQKTPTLKKTKGVSYSATQSDQLFSISSDASSTSAGSIPDAIELENTGDTPIFAIVGYETYSGDATDAGVEYLHTLIMPGEMYIPPIRGIIATGADTVIVDGTALDNAVPDANMYTDSTADVDHATAATIGSDAAHTTLNLEDGHSKFFRVGDLIRLENEICEVTAVGTGADLANSTCTIIRGVHGSTAATHADDVAVRFPFFNAYHDFDAFSVAQTNNDGRFKCTNLFGQGRTSSGNFGITPGSFNIKFYNPGYQSLGLSGITSSTNSGLAVSTEYGFDITVDGSGLLNSDTLKFTTDASNVNWGGINGILSKINEVFNTQYYTAGNLLNERVSVGIVDGDIRFTSGQRLSTSAILLAAPSQGEATPFGVGRVPAIGAVNSPIAAKLPVDVKYDPITYTTSPTNVFGYDNGAGSIKGYCSGSINYETGALNISGPANAQFVYSAMVNTAFSGKANEGTADRENIIKDIYVNTPNTKGSGNVELRVY